MYIRNRQDALDVLAEALDLETRTEQIVAVTVDIVMCLDPDPRSFLCDCQSALIEGGLEEMRRRRRESLESQDLEPIVILDPEGDVLYEEIASSRDALRVAEIVREVFPEIAQNYPLWAIGRCVLLHEKEIGNCCRQAIRSRGEGDRMLERSVALQTAQELVRSSDPEWSHRAGAIRQACLDVVLGAGLASAADASRLADILFTTIALRDTRALPFLEWIDRDPQQVVDFVGKLNEIRAAVEETDAPQAAPAVQSEVRRQTA